MIYLLDTNTCIQYITGRSPKVLARLQQQQPQDVLVCSVVKGELFYGAMRSTDPTTTLAKQHRFLRAYASVPFDDRAAVEYGRIRADLQGKGTPIGPNDLMIAAIAVAHALILVTHNRGTKAI